MSMANWKEIGVVPDSDEEDDLVLENSNTENDTAVGDRSHEQEENDVQNLEQEFHDKRNEHSKEVENHFEATQDVPMIECEKSSPPATPHDAGNRLNLSEVLGKRSHNLHSSPSSPKVFKVPKLFWEDEGDEIPPERPDISTQQDEISRSYVQITSPESSQLSLPPDSQLSLPPNRQSISRSGPIPPSIEDLEGEGSLLDPQSAEDAITYQISEQVGPLRHRLRERKPIQLHPYIVEQEKYRQTLKARGIKSTRLVSSQDEPPQGSRESTSPDQESQAIDSQDVDFVVDESQPMNIDLNPSPSSSPPGPTVHSRAGAVDEQLSDNHGDDDEDDEFPDLNDLVRMPPNPPSQQRLRKRIKSYSTKGKRHPLSNIQTHSHHLPPIEAVKNRFDIPASPPATSSPFPPSSRRSRQPLSRLSSISSVERTPSIPVQRVVDTRVTHSLPSPASASKPLFGPGSESDSDDPFAEPREQSASVSSSSDESVQIRKISKRFRGVLPASHLRLDRPKSPQPPSRNQRESRSLSPIIAVPRRGVAVRKILGDAQSASSSNNHALPVLSDDSDSGDEGNGLGSMSNYSEGPTTLQRGLDPSRLGYAEENDNIDAMLPTKKRPSSNLTQQLRKKRRIGSASILGNGDISLKRQGKITKHLGSTRKSKQVGKPLHRPTHSESAHPRSRHDAPGRTWRAPPPRLGILDIVDSHDGTHNEMPDFIKVAARAARSRKGYGRQSPSSKFIRLATREDTEDVQSVLNDWRGGRMQPRKQSSAYGQRLKSFRTPLGQVENNINTKFPGASVKTRRLQARSNSERTSAMPRKLHIFRNQQLSMTNFISRGDEVAQHQELDAAESNVPSIPHLRQKMARNMHDMNQHIRPAQLELSEAEYSRQNPKTAFRTIKKALDTFYRSARKRPVPKNLPLDRFLADEDIVRPSTETGQPVMIPDLEPSEPHAKQLEKERRLKKRMPKQVDASALRYRQPSNPLILEHFPTRSPSIAEEDNKLKGLGKFGTNYTCHFDILPLHPGTFFHENTFIGQGKLSEIVKYNPIIARVPRSPISLTLGEKTFSWGVWDGVVSSEVGVCLDWLAERHFANPLEDNTHKTESVSVMVYVLDYVRHHISFSSPLDLKHFLSRMIEIVRDLSSRFAYGGEAHRSRQEGGERIDILSICVLLVLQLLKMARTQEDQMFLAYDLEDLMKAVTGGCIDALLVQGLDGIRKLYDDLQYLSFREHGIKNDQHEAQAWVIVIKALAAAQIPRGSFWDVMNPRLLVNLQDLRDAPNMEKIWYSMYSLLPLCEVDDSGFVISNLRQKAAFDNWLIPQQLIKRVTSFYITNRRQVPGFNDYCRSLVARCHYLMTYWGWWKCSSIIGTLFDFFASQKLANLRNEEVYASPHFLAELDTEPSLAVEPEDRCFHIFLKMVARLMKHLNRTGDMKSIRNLVPRLLPNHDRQYSKDEDVHERDIASLRNHHDLLCTIYWAAPANERLSLGRIQELVVADHSHNEACLINLRAWEYLARFIVTTSTDVKDYEPLREWQATFFSKLCQQYLGIKDEVRKQAEIFQQNSTEIMTENRIYETIIANMRSTIVPMCVSITTMGTAIKAAKSSIMLRQALNCDVLSRAFDPAIYSSQQVSEKLLSDCLLVLSNYMDQIDHMHPLTNISKANGIEDDFSQDSLDAVDWDRLDLIKPLRDTVVDSLCCILKNYLDTLFEATKDSLIMYRFVDCWARLVSFVTENELVTENEVMNLDSFLKHGKRAAFENRNTYTVANEYWPLFLAKLLQYGKTLDDLQRPGFNLGLEWLLSLLKSKPIALPEQSLSLQLQEKSHYFLIGSDTTNRVNMLRGAIRKMSSLLIEGRTGAEISLTPRDAQRLFSDILGEVMKTMQRNLESTEPGSNPQKKYVEIVQLIVEDIKSYAGDIKPLSDFFIHPSKFYWPPEGDPDLFGPGIVPYCLRLGKHPERSSWELLWYLLNRWKGSMVSGRMDNYMNGLNQGMKRWDFYKWMLSEFLPPALEVGFSADGWVFCSTFLPPLARGAARLLEEGDDKSQLVFEHLVNLLKIIMNGTIAHSRRPGGIQPSTRGILAVAYKFWFSIAPPMCQFIERHPSEADTLLEVVEPLSHFIYHALQTFASSEPAFWHPTRILNMRKGKLHDKFSAAFVEDIKEFWEFEDEVGEKVVVKSRTKERSPVQWFGVTLKEVLEGEVAMYQVLFPGNFEVRVLLRRNVFIDDLYC